MPARLPTAAQVQQSVAEVLRRPEYQEHHGIREWIGRQLARALIWIGDRLASFASLRDTAPVIFWTVVVWLVATVLFIIAHLVWTAVQASRRTEEKPGAATAAERTRARTAADWEAEAGRLAAEGRLREAAVALYQALVLRLDARGAVRYDPSKTPGEYRREARRTPDAARTLTAFLRLFEPVAFGGRPLDSEGWERMRSAAAEGAAGA